MRLFEKKIESWKHILAIAWPLIIANSFWNLQLTTDRIFLGSFSTLSLGAAMTVMGIFWTPMALLQQTSAYVTTFVAQYSGAKNYGMIGPALWHSIFISVVGGFLFLLLIPVSPQLFNFIGHSEVVKELEILYFDSLCYSALPAGLVAAFSGFFIGIDQSKEVMKVNAVGLIFNVLFGYLLIFGEFGFPKFGIEGAGYATAIANYLAAFYGFYRIWKYDTDKKYNLLGGYHLNSDIAKRYLKYGIPSGMQWALEGLAFTVFLTIMGRFENGEVALASSSIAVTVMMLSILPSIGMAQAVMMLVARYLGEGKPDVAEKTSWDGVSMALVYMLFMSFTFILFPQFYLGWFKNESDLSLWNQVSETVPYILMFMALFTLFDSINFILSFALKGAGDTRFVLFVSILLPWPLMVLPTYLMREFSGAIYYSWAAATGYGICLSIFYYVRFANGQWKKMSVIK